MGERQNKPGRGKKRGAPDENESTKFAKNALLKKFGSLDNAMQMLLASGEPQLIRFVYEHAFGKVTEKRQLSGLNGEPLPPYVTIGGKEASQVTKLPDNFEGDDEKVVPITKEITKPTGTDEINPSLEK